MRERERERERERGRNEKREDIEKNLNCQAMRFGTLKRCTIDAPRLHMSST
jgi:hypothetical protein